MGNAQLVAMLRVDALAELQHSRDDQIVFVGEEQRKGLSTGDLSDCVGQQRFDDDWRELFVISYWSLHSRSLYPDPIGRSIHFHMRTPIRSSRETANGSVRRPPALNAFPLPTAQISLPLSL